MFVYIDINRYHKKECHDAFHTTAVQLEITMSLVPHNLCVWAIGGLARLVTMSNGIIVSIETEEDISRERSWNDKRATERLEKGGDKACIGQVVAWSSFPPHKDTSQPFEPNTNHSTEPHISLFLSLQLIIQPFKPHTIRHTGDFHVRTQTPPLRVTTGLFRLSFGFHHSKIPPFLPAKGIVKSVN